MVTEAKLAEAGPPVLSQLVLQNERRPTSRTTRRLI
jgi:hypothetical protein